MGLNEALYKYMAGISLQDIVDNATQSKSETKVIAIDINLDKQVPALM